LISVGHVTSSSITVRLVIRVNARNEPILQEDESMEEVEKLQAEKQRKKKRKRSRTLRETAQTSSS